MSSRDCERRERFSDWIGQRALAVVSRPRYWCLEGRSALSPRLPVAAPNRSETSIEQKSAENPRRDRKSTRLNSSHVKISYAVFCLKKKTTSHATLTMLMI